MANKKAATAETKEIEFTNIDQAKQYLLEKGKKEGQLSHEEVADKLANFELLKNEKEEIPILLLDDIMSELDSKRINFLLKYIENYQSIITTTEDTFVKNIENIKILKVSNGVLEN